MQFITRTFLFAALVVLAGSTVVTAMPPHPDLLNQVAAGKKASSFYLDNRDALREQGLCRPSDQIKRALFAAKEAASASASSEAGTPFRILALLVEFSDHQNQVNAPFFDSLVFDSIGATVRDYFSEISYAQIDLVTVNLPSTLDWRTAPQTYAYYVNNQQGLGSYPQNSQKLVEDLVDQVDPLVDFSQYDNDGDGYVDVVMVIHSGAGAEMTGSNADIWSHKWGINPRNKDGVFIFDYTMQPEYWTTPGDMTIGVYAHELAHGFGLPDLYDTDGSSNGLGRWCLMAYGSWNGPGGRGDSPSHPCAWSRINMNMANYTNVTTPLQNQIITPVEQSGLIYRMWTGGLLGQEYFLVENRQRTGYDSYLPSEGLMIWHIDDVKNALSNPNDQEWYPGQPSSAHYGVALEPADGLWELEHAVDAGDAGDPFPGTSSRTTFSDSSTPNANAYSGAPTNVQVSAITPTGDDIQANLIVTLAAGTDDDPPASLPVSAVLNQNYPNPFNPTTVISFSLTSAADVQVDIFNLMGQKVRSLYKERAASGDTELAWDATSDSGEPVASGIYLYRMVAGEQELTRKMVLIK